MDWMFGDESDSDICTERRESSQENTGDIEKPSQQNNKVGAIFSLLRMQSVSVGFAWFLIRRVVPSAPSLR